MKDRTPFPVDVISLRAKDRTPDRNSVIVSLTTPLSAEQLYSVPVSCLFDLIADLQKLSGATHSPLPTVSEGPPPAATTQTKDLNQVKVIGPKKWMLKSGLPNHPFVVMIMDPQTENQAGYALTASAAVKWLSVLPNMPIL
jgi:hypothetical protein